MTKLTNAQIETAKGKIFENIASAVSNTNQDNWEMVVLRAEEIIKVAVQLQRAKEAEN